MCNVDSPTLLFSFLPDKTVLMFQKTLANCLLSPHVTAQPVSLDPANDHLHPLHISSSSSSSISCSLSPSSSLLPSSSHTSTANLIPPTDVDIDQCARGPRVCVFLYKQLWYLSRHVFVQAGRLLAPVPLISSPPCVGLRVCACIFAAHQSSPG